MSIIDYSTDSNCIKEEKKFPQIRERGNQVRSQAPTYCILWKQWTVSDPATNKFSYSDKATKSQNHTNFRTDILFPYPTKIEDRSE